MRNLLMLLLLSTSVLYASCRTCTLKKCSDYYELRLSGFSQSDLEGSCLLTAESDSIPLQIEASEGQSYYYIPDFEVGEESAPIIYSFPVAEKTYVLSDFRFEKHECNKCTVGKDLYSQFSGCKVNGVEQRGNIITLEK